MNSEQDVPEINFQYKGMQIIWRKADITAQTTDAIVNAANEYLAHGAGVAGAISRVGGYTIDSESSEWVDKHGQVPTGETAYTSKGNLPCKKYCIHAVGPVWGYQTPDDSNKLLYQAIVNSFKRAEELECESVALPAISSGIFGYPLEQCCMIFAKTTRIYINKLTKIGNLKTLVMCNIDTKTSSAIRDAFSKEFEDEIKASEEVKQETTEEDKKEEVKKDEDNDEPNKEEGHQDLDTEEGVNKETQKLPDHHTIPDGDKPDE